MSCYKTTWGNWRIIIERNTIIEIDYGMTDHLFPCNLLPTDACPPSPWVTLQPVILGNDMIQTDRWAPFGWVWCPLLNPISLFGRTPEIEAASAVMEEQSRQEEYERVWENTEPSAVTQGVCWYSEKKAMSGDMKRVTTSHGRFHSMKRVEKIHCIQTSQRFKHTARYRFKMQLKWEVSAWFIGRGTWHESKTFHMNSEPIQKYSQNEKQMLLFSWRIVGGATRFNVMRGH